MKKSLLAILLFMLFFLAACGGNEQENDDNTEESNTEDTSEFSPVTVEGENGEVTISEKPERIIAPYMEDALVALGVKPVAQWFLGGSPQEYLQDELADVDTIEWNMPLEQTLSYEPDLLILSALDNMEGQLSDYENIATTYVFKPEDLADVRKQVTIVGKLLGKEQEAEDRIDQYEEKIASAKEALSDTVGEETVAVLWAIGDQYFMFEQDRHTGEVIYGELGLKPSPLTVELGEAEETWNPISLEKIAELKTDHLFLLGEEDAAGIQTLQNSEVYKSLPVVQNEQVYRITDASNWTNRGIVAFEKTVDDILEAFGE